MISAARTLSALARKTRPRIGSEHFLCHRFRAKELIARSLRQSDPIIDLKALAAYRQALNLSGDRRSEGEILNAVARVQRKSGLLREAAATYEKMSRDYGGVVISDGIPLGAAARLELATVFRDLNDGAGSVSALLDLYKSLLRPEWFFEKGQFVFFQGG